MMYSSRLPRGGIVWQRLMAVVILLIGVLVFPVSINFAQDAGSGFATLDFAVANEIAVQADTPVINVGPRGSFGEFDVFVDFTVQANTRNVDMFVEATNFYFDADPAGTQVDPIALVESAGAEISAQGATALSGSRAGFVAAGDTIDGFPSRKTESLTFQSNKDQTFHHAVSVAVTWHLEPMKPAGNYSAKVRLTCIALPPE